MEQSKADLYIMTNSKYFPPQSIPEIRQRILQIPDEKFVYLHTVQLKDPTTALLLSIFLGTLGVDRFYLNHVGLGLGKLFTGGGCGIWWLVDVILISDATRQVNYDNFIRSAAFL